jgi:hypothetical protein
METQVTEYGNGPLPVQFESAAYFTHGRREWALPKGEALTYLDWCEQRGLNVLGFEVWYPTTPGPTITDLGLGNIEGVAAARDGITQHPGRYVSGSVVFNITVAEHEPIPILANTSLQPTSGRQASASESQE